MKAGFVYMMVAGLATGAFASSSLPAQADDYFAVLSPRQAMAERSDNVLRVMDRTVSSPVIIEREGMSSVMLVGTSTSTPIMIEKTTVARPHHWPFSFGVWP